jgi:uncharacterized BrkB/YihY/UPF0761 family membrane protein
MDQEAKDILKAQQEQLDAIHRSVEQTRRYFMMTLIISVVVVVLPLIGLLFAIPQFLSVYSTDYAGLLQ